ncbi:phage tail tape measure protein, partial [Clostridium sp. CF012]|uniref:phage tail tape measure protein n=1 Tax=Clostridium sp. CF012 TaxID=2843319 RepID=UPI001C0E5E18
AKKNFEKAGDKAVKLGIAMATLAAGFVIKVGFEGMKELDEAAAKVKSIAGASLEKKDIKKGLLKTSSDTGISTTELGDTQYNAISSGVSGANSLEAALVSAKLAKAGFTDSNSALKVLMSTMNVYGKSGTKAMQSISDKMLIVQNLGVTTVAELAEGMGSVTPIAKAAGASIDELDAGMIALTKNGIKTDEAAVQLKGMFTSIIAPSKESADMAKSLGLEFNAATLKSKGFAKFMADVRTKTGGSTEKMAGLFGNVRALTGALVLSGSGFKDFNNGLVALKNSAGATDYAFNIMADTLGSRLNKLKVRTKNIATGIMDNTSGAIGKLVSKITDKLKVLEESGGIQRFVDKIALGVTKIIEVIGKVFNFLKDNKKTIENVALVFASFYVAIKIMKVLKGVIFGVQIAMALLSGGLALTPFGWVAIGITALIVGFTLLYKNSAEFREGVAGLVAKLKEFGSYIVTNALPPLKQFGNYIMTTIVPILKDMAITIKDTVVNAFNFLYPIISNFVTSILMPLVGFLSSVLKPIFGVVFSYILDVVKSKFNMIKGVVEGAIKVFGGIIQFVTGVFTGDWSKAWKGVVNIFSGIFGGIKSICEGILNGVINKINLVTGLMSKIPGVKIGKIGNVGVEDKGTKVKAITKPKVY